MTLLNIGDFQNASNDVLSVNFTVKS